MDELHQIKTSFMDYFQLIYCSDCFCFSSNGTYTNACGPCIVAVIHSGLRSRKEKRKPNTSFDDKCKLDRFCIPWVDLFAYFCSFIRQMAWYCVQSNGTSTIIRHWLIYSNFKCFEDFSYDSVNKQMVSHLLRFCWSKTIETEWFWKLAQKVNSKKWVCLFR